MFENLADAIAAEEILCFIESFDPVSCLPGLYLVELEERRS